MAAAVEAVASMATEAVAMTLVAVAVVILCLAVRAPKPMRMPCRMVAAEAAAVEAVSRCMAVVVVVHRTATRVISRVAADLVAAAAVAATADRLATTRAARAAVAEVAVVDTVVAEVAVAAAQVVIMAAAEEAPLL